MRELFEHSCQNSFKCSMRAYMHKLEFCNFGIFIFFSISNHDVLICGNYLPGFFFLEIIKYGERVLSKFRIATFSEVLMCTNLYNIIISFMTCNKLILHLSKKKTFIAYIDIFKTVYSLDLSLFLFYNNAISFTEIAINETS